MIYTMQHSLALCPVDIKKDNPATAGEFNTEFMESEDLIGPAENMKWTSMMHCIP